MKKKFLYLLAAAALVLLGCGFMTVPGYQFSGMICFGCAAVVLCYWFFALYPGGMIKWIRRCFTVLLLLGVLLACVTGGFILSAWQGTSDVACDYVIVLGAGVNGTVPSLILRERLDATLEYMNANQEVICVVSGGQGPGEEITEAACMQQFLVDRGIDPRRIWMEDKATSTWENITFSLDLIEKQTGERPETAGVVSNEFHLFRAGYMAQKQQLTAIGIPAKTGWVSLRINYFLREIVAVWKLILLGY